jgi:hypothetical protein
MVGQISENPLSYQRVHGADTSSGPAALPIRDLFPRRRRKHRGAGSPWTPASCSMADATLKAASLGETGAAGMRSDTRCTRHWAASLAAAAGAGERQTLANRRTPTQ